MRLSLPGAGNFIYVTRSFQRAEMALMDDTRWAKGVGGEFGGSDDHTLVVMCARDHPAGVNITGHAAVTCFVLTPIMSTRSGWCGS